MSVEISVRRIAHNNHILEFIVTDDYTIHAVLCTASDPTMTDANFIVIDSTDCYRNVQVDRDSGEIIESSIETLDAFVNRAYSESREWADEAIAEQAAARQLADALAAILPQGVDK